MSLYTDNDCITAADLQAVDAECATVATAQTPPIALEGDRSVIRRAIEQCGSKIMAVSQTMTGYYVSAGMGLNHVMAVMNVGGFGLERPRFMLNQLVALDPDPSKREFRIWLENMALHYLYRDAVARFGTQSDRYAMKMDLYRDEASSSWGRLCDRGFPVIISGYLACPGAIREYNAGTWDSTNISATGSGSAETGHAYNVVITYTGSGYVSPTNKMNSESGPSAMAAIQVPSGKVISISITSLVPPTSTAPDLGIADGVTTRMAAAGWNVYVGLSNSTIIYRQNSTPIAIGTMSYTLVGAPVLSGAQPGLGQYSTINLTYAPLFKRG